MNVSASAALQSVAMAANMSLPVVRSSVVNVVLYPLGSVITSLISLTHSGCVTVMFWKFFVTTLLAMSQNSCILLDF